MASIARCLRASVLGLTAISVVALTYLLPEAGLLVVTWLLGVAVLWRRSPGTDA
jgi:hypothetical protein